MGCNSLTNPFYVNACGIQSQQTLTIFDYFYSSSVLTSSSFIIPSCNSTFTVKVAGLFKTAPNMYLWHPTYGYFKIVNYNYSTCTLTLLNECQTVNASPGFNVPACTVFITVDTPCCYNAVNYLSYPYLEIDFVIPAVDDCATVKFTNVHGVILGQFVQIAGGTYYVSSVLNATDLVICNNGGGGIPGTVVYAKNVSGEYITPVDLLVEEVCDRDTAYEGALNICTDSINSAVLDGDVVAEVPALIDTATNFVEFMDPNEAIALSMCDQDVSAAIQSFNQEYTAFLAANTTLTVPGEEVTVSLTVTVENDTCHTLYMMVGVCAFFVSELIVEDGEWANFTLDITSLGDADSPSSSPSATASSSPSSSPSPSSSVSVSPSESPSSSPSP